jgi:hypothetical protein
VNLRNSFRVSLITSEAPIPVPSVPELLIRVQSRPVWDGASISSEGAQFPLVHVNWARRPRISPSMLRGRRIMERLLGDESAFLAAFNRSRARRASTGTVAARTVRICGTCHSGAESFFEYRQAGPGARVGQNRRLPAQNSVGRSRRQRNLGTCEPAQRLTGALAWGDSPPDIWPVAQPSRYNVVEVY